MDPEMRMRRRLVGTLWRSPLGYLLFEDDGNWWLLAVEQSQRADINRTLIGERVVVDGYQEPMLLLNVERIDPRE